MNPERPLLDQVFILRFWRESAGGSEDDRWRVLVRNINTKRRDVVDDVQRAFAIITANLGARIQEPEASQSSTDEPRESLRRQRKRARPSND